jgi:hypothetical protein
MIAAFKQSSPLKAAKELIQALFTREEIRSSCATTKGKSNKKVANQQIIKRIQGKL